MTEYTPTTDEVRDLWENSLSHGCANREAMADADWDDERMVAQFDRWLAQVKAEAQVEALRDAAGSGQFVGPIADLLASRADRIAREAGIATEGNETGEE